MKKLMTILTGGVLLAACSSKDSPSPDFNVQGKSATYTLGDTAFFKLAGNPYNLTFYAGDSSREYKYRNRTSAPGKPELLFNSYRQGGAQDNSLKVLVSTDFTGIYDSANVYSPNVHWTDITSKTILSTGTNNTSSGVVDLSDFLNGGKPVYIAYQYTGAKSTVAQRTWTIPLFTVTNVLTEGAVRMPVAGSLAEASWAIVKMKSGVQWAANATQLKVTGGAANSAEAESWVITKPLFLNRAVPDKGVSIKNISANRLEQHYFIYKAAGNYTATFEAANTTRYDSKIALKEVPVTILP